LSAHNIHSRKDKFSFQTFSQTFVPPNFPNETFVPSNVKFPQNVLFPQFHFSSSLLNQNPNSLNFTFQHRRTYLSSSQWLSRSTTRSRCVLLLLLRLFAFHIWWLFVFLELEWCVLVSIWSSFGFVVDESLVGICCGFWFVLLILIVLYVLRYQIMLSFLFYFPFPLNKRN